MALRRSIAPGCPTMLEPGDDTNNSAADFSADHAEPAQQLGGPDRDALRPAVAVATPTGYPPPTPPSEPEEEEVQEAQAPLGAVAAKKCKKHK